MYSYSYCNKLTPYQGLEHYKELVPRISQLDCVSIKILATILKAKILCNPPDNLGLPYVHHDSSVSYKQSASMFLKKNVYFTLGCQRKISRARQGDLLTVILASLMTFETCSDMNLGQSLCPDPS